MNNTSGKPKRKLEKFLTTSRSREKNKTISKLNTSNLNNDTSPNNSSEKRQYKYEYANVKKDYINNISTIKNDEEGKNILVGLVKEGLISIDEPELDESKIDINNLKYKEINLEKLFQKLLFLNKSLNSSQNERKKLENEQNTFLNAVNETKSNNESKDMEQEKNNDINNNKRNMRVNLREKENNEDIGDDTIGKNRNNFNEILKKYEEDLKFFEDLISNNNNNYNEFK